MTSQQMITSPTDLRAFVTDCLSAAGASSKDAWSVAEVMLWAEMRGRSPQGVIWTDTFCRRLEAGTIRSPSEAHALHSRFPTRIRIDAAGGFGQVAGILAVDAAQESAEMFGVGVATVRNSTHYGPSGYYAHRLAEHGLIGLSATNARPKVAPPGGTTAALGTNPIAFAAPVDGRAPIVGDLSTGALAGSRVRAAVGAGQPLADGQLLDARGRPTNDPAALAAGGVMLPMAGGKGFALGLLVEVLTSVLAAGSIAQHVNSMFEAATPPNTSHVVIALHPDDGDFSSRTRELTDQILALGSTDVRIPGWGAASEASDDNSLALTPDTAASLASAAKRLGVPVPRWVEPD